MRRIFNLSEKDVISIVGAGGKTSLMFALGEELRKEFRVMITTTTKIFVPRNNQYDFMFIGEDAYSTRNIKHKGIYIYGKKINSENKIIGFQGEELNKIIESFDYVIIESDGSKMKPLKGWGEQEPVICSDTDKTIGVFDISTIGNYIENKLIHRMDKFLNITGGDLEEEITVEHGVNLILHEEGLFKDSKGEKILFINKVESNEDKLQAHRLNKRIKEINPNYLHRIVAGSVKSGMFEVLH
ncbi:selenium cofactor biosynthesis protein YqeC [Clostridium malenominatum]|uniref:Selenium cofactor biosynthesis protein YqeC n=1 Tax=Clostridium malenominatum TaxID=1539 RepID=A0ABP3UE81_9CLOT